MNWLIFNKKQLMIWSIVYLPDRLTDWTTEDFIFLTIVFVLSERTTADPSRDSRSITLPPKRDCRCSFMWLLNLWGLPDWQSYRFTFLNCVTFCIISNYMYLLSKLKFLWGRVCYNNNDFWNFNPPPGALCW